MGLLYVLLGEVSVQVLHPFFNWIACLPGIQSIALYVFWKSNPCLRYHWKICFLIWLVPFSFCWGFLTLLKTLKNWCKHLVKLRELQLWSFKVRSSVSLPLTYSCNFLYFLLVFPKLCSPKTSKIHVTRNWHVKSLIFILNPNGDSIW